MEAGLPVPEFGVYDFFNQPLSVVVDNNEKGFSLFLSVAGVGGSGFNKGDLEAWVNLYSGWKPNLISLSRDTFLYGKRSDLFQAWLG